MITGNESIYPIDKYFSGLTIRQYYAGLAMQGLIASIGNHDVIEASEIANDAVLFADALIAELNKTEK